MNGAALKAKGQAQTRLDPWEASIVTQAIKHLADSDLPFTADDVHDLGLPELVSPAALGAAFTQLARRDLIRQVGWARSRRPGNRCGVRAVWTKGQQR